MACHIYDYLKLFGPVQSWWCFPFECLIGHLQRLPLNDKFGEPCVYFTSDYGVSNSFVGEMEQTALHAFIHSARLKSWFARADHPPAISACKELFDKYVQPGNAESSYSSTVSEKRPASSCTPSDLFPLVSQSHVVLHARYTFGGVVFSRHSTHMGNSLIIFYPSGNLQLFPVPGSIKYIFEHVGHVHFAVQQQLPSKHGADPFHHYPHFLAQLYSCCMSDSLEMIHPAWVLSHYAWWRFSPQCDVILTLAQVCHFCWGLLSADCP